MDISSTSKVDICVDAAACMPALKIWGSSIITWAEESEVAQETSQMLTEHQLNKENYKINILGHGCFHLQT